MKKEEKRKRYILRLFKDYSDDEILEMLKKQDVIWNSSQYAKKILKTYNRYYLLDSSKFINKYFKLYECIQYRNLENKIKYDNFEVSIDDIKEHLTENMIEEISIIEENTFEDSYFGANFKLVELHNQYGKIFNDLKNDYLLVGTLNLFNLSQGYICPVFIKNNKYYFQNGANCEEIEGFTEISSEEVIGRIKFLILNCPGIYLDNVKMLYKIKDKFIDACQLKGKIFISNTESMREYLYSFNITNDVMKQGTFKENIKGNYQKRR